MHLNRAFTSRAAAIAALVLTAAVAAPALGASATAPSTLVSTQTATGPAVIADAGGPVDVQIWPAQENNQTAVLVDVEVPTSTKLPAVVRVPIMPGTTIQWAGEILGGDPSADPQRAYVLRNGVGGTFAEFTVSKTRRAQVDSVGVPLTVNGAISSISMTWVQSVKSQLTAISVRIPTGVSQVKINPAPTGPPATNAAGESLYVLNPVSYQLGQKQDIKISYSSESSTAAAGSSSTTLLVALAAALVLAVVVLVIVIARQRRSTSGDEGDEGEDHDEVEEADEGDESDGGDTLDGSTPVVTDEPSGRDSASEVEPGEESGDEDTDLTWD